MFEFLRFTLTLLVGIAVGWGVSARYHGLSVNPWAANTTAQASVDSAVSANSSIESAERDTGASETRVQYVTRTVEVDKACPPGTGALSDDVANRLRAAVAEASNPSGITAASLRDEGDEPMRTSKD